MNQRPRPEQSLAYPARSFDESDLRMQRAMLTYDCTWNEQYEIPPRPWSAADERHCERVRRDLELEDWEVEQERKAGR